MSPLRRTVFAAGALGVSLAVFVPWLGFDYRLRPHASAVNDYWKARVPDMIYGRAHRPFVRRTLVPSTLRVLRRALPRPVLAALRRTASGSPLFLPRKLGVLGWEPAYMVEYVVAIPLLFGLLSAFPFALRGLFAALYDAPRAELLAPLLATALLPVLFFDRGTHYLYDFSTLLLFTLALGCLQRARVRAFYVVFVLGCLNKETMILATLLFAAVEMDRMPRSRLWRHLAAQALIFAAVEWALGRAYAHNPGAGAEWHLVKNLRLMRAHPDVASVAFLVSGAILTLARFGQKPVLLRRGAIVVLAPLLVSYLFLGIYGEIRVFYEAYPILFLLAFQNTSEAVGFPLRERGAATAIA